MFWWSKRPIAQWITSPTANQWVASLILAQSHNFMEIDNSHSPPSADSRRSVVSYKIKYRYKVLVNHLVKLAQEKVWLGELTLST